MSLHYHLKPPVKTCTSSTVAHHRAAFHFLPASCSRFENKDWSLRKSLDLSKFREKNSASASRRDLKVEEESAYVSKAPRLDEQTDERADMSEGFYGQGSFSEQQEEIDLEGMSLQKLNRELMRERRVLPRRIILVRHGESEGNIDETKYSSVPDPRIKLTAKGKQQASKAGHRLREMFEKDPSYRVFFYLSPYRRSQQTCLGIAQCFPREKVVGLREEVQLREQDFGNFQDTHQKTIEKAERIRYGRFYYRFPHGESGADVYDRVTVFQDHLVRDIDTGNFHEDSNVVLITHGLTLRIFLSRWFHWTISELEEVWNPPNSFPIVLERVAANNMYEDSCRLDGMCDPGHDFHTKELYSLTPESIKKLQGCTTAMGNKIDGVESWRRTLSFEDDFDSLDDLEASINEYDGTPCYLTEECHSPGCERDHF
mmetsp:Transcript_16670/g.22981  ORF Transcript_16670/g.22981 Transcript_16670/m.22981 type:complete len:428 (-) Transcript_16670:136-1419(-)